MANLNMTDPNDSCPPGFPALTVNSKTFCHKYGLGCASVVFPVHGVKYSKVCGKVIGYQYFYYNHLTHTIDDIYVDGISLTYGTSPRSFASAQDETRSSHVVYSCTKINTGVVPPFVNNDYFCDTGSHYRYSSQWYTADPLWDGDGCGETSTCCEFNSPPWFCKDLPESTTDDIEMRVCKSNDGDNENIGLESVIIYIQ